MTLSDTFEIYKESKETQLNIDKEIIDYYIESYRSLEMSEDQPTQSKTDLLSKKRALKNDIDDFYKKTYTDERKIYYEDNAITKLKFYKMLILIVYYSILGIYIIFGGFFSNKKYKNIFVLLIIALYILFPFLLSYIEYIFN